MTTRTAATNRRLAKKRVQCLNEVLYFVSSSVLADSLVLRNPLLRQAPKRYAETRREFLTFLKCIKMKFILTIICLSLGTIINGFSQQIDPISTIQDTSSRKNAIYLEYAGNAPILSLNYERKLSHKNIFAIYGRIGFGMDILNLNQGNLYVPSLPVEFSTSIGREKHFIELGIGGTPFLSKTEMWSSAAYYDDLNIDSIDYELYFIFTPRIGYRYESESGWLLRLAFTPILYNSCNLNDKYQTNFGLSLGKLF